MINFVAGIVTGLVLIQFFPRLSLVGAYLVKKSKALLLGANGA